jgi:hypothetical protein
MAYKTFSRTGSGWEISHDPGAVPTRQWRIVHEQWGTYFFATHDEARDEAFRITFEKTKGMLGLVEEDKEPLSKLSQLIMLLADCDPVTRQKVLEMALAKHVITVTETVGREKRDFVIDSIVKHVRQFIGDYETK